MPTYEYGCITCEKKKEVARGFSDPEVIPQCPNCGYMMARVYSAVGVQFKGSGFYKTDNG